MSFVSAVATPPREAVAPLAPVLVAPAWLRAQLADVQIVDTRAAGAYRAGHIAGAHSFPLDALVVDDTSHDALERIAAAVARALANRGVSPSDHVVLVDDHEESAALGGLLCELAGVSRVSVLLGGIAAWRATGGELTYELRERTSERADWSAAATCMDRLATFEQLVDASERGTAHVLDVRSQLEHEGIVGPPCCAERGSIPDALHLEWTNFFDLAGAPRLASDVRTVLAQVGIDIGDEVIVTCHSGRRAAAAACVLRASGLARVRVSIGSWHEWSQRRTAADTGERGHVAPHAHAAR